MLTQCGYHQTMITCEAYHERKSSETQHDSDISYRCIRIQGRTMDNSYYNMHGGKIVHSLYEAAMLRVDCMQTKIL